MSADGPPTEKIHFSELAAQSSLQLFKAARPGRADRRHGHVHPESNIRIGQLIRLIKQHFKEVPTAFWQSIERLADQLLALQCLPFFVGQECGCRNISQRISIVSLTEACSRSFATVSGRDSPALPR